MIESLRVQNFRCFESMALSFSEQGGIFIGENAQGKTSILEAICVLMRLQSPRAKQMRPLTKFDASGFGVAGEHRGCQLSVRYGSGVLGLAIDGDSLEKQNAYLQESGLIVWMGNEDIDLVRGSGGGRRRYLDFICSQIDMGYRRALSRYRRALKARNALLKNTLAGVEELNAYAAILIEHGDYISRARAEMVKMLQPLANAAQMSISGKKEELTLEYVLGSGGCMQQALESSAESEKRQRQTLVGPHRDELRLNLNGMPAIDFASEGQQRTLALALKLAQGEVLSAQSDSLPMYLMDDIFGELDPLRRNALMRMLPKQAQKFITTTYVDWMHDSDWEQWKSYTVCDGNVRERNS